MKRLITSTVAAAAIAATTTSSAQSEPVELTMFYPIAVGGPLTEVVDGLVSDFESGHPNIDVEAVYAGNYDDTRVRALSALETDNPPELSVMFSIDMFQLVARDAIVPFDQLVEGEQGRKWLDSFYPALMKNGRLDGKTYGIPFQRSTIVLYWNKDLFRKAGLDPDQPPETWAEMARMGSRIRAATNGESWGVMVPSTGYPYWMFQAFAYQNGHRVMSRDGTETYFDAPASVEALEYWTNLSDTHNAMPSGTIEWGTLRRNFLEGETAMMWHSTGNLTAVRKNADFDFGVAMLPKREQRGSPTGGGNFYIFKQASDAQRQAALELVQWMTAPRRAARWSIKTGYMGVSPAAYDTQALESYVEDFPAAAVARNQLKHATAELSTYNGGRVRDALNDAIQSALTGQQSPQEALETAQDTAERALRRYQ